MADRNFYDRVIECTDACNGQAVMLFLVEQVLPGIKAEPECNGTDYINKHPAVTVVLEKLAELNGDYGWSVTHWQEAYHTCKQRSTLYKV